MKVKYVGSHDAVDVHGVGTVKQGESVEVSTELGKSLLEQKANWQIVKPPAKKTAAKKTAATTPQTAAAESEES